MYSVLNFQDHYYIVFLFKITLQINYVSYEAIIAFLDYKFQS